MDKTYDGTKYLQVLSETASVGKIRLECGHELSYVIQPFQPTIVSVESLNQEFEDTEANPPEQLMFLAECLNGVRETMSVLNTDKNTAVLITETEPVVIPWNDLATMEADFDGLINSCKRTMHDVMHALKQHNKEL